MHCSQEPFSSANDEQLSHKLDHNSILSEWMEIHRFLLLLQVMLTPALLIAYANATCTAETMTQNEVTLSLTNQKTDHQPEFLICFQLKIIWNMQDAMELFQLCATATQYSTDLSQDPIFCFPITI